MAKTDGVRFMVGLFGAAGGLEPATNGFVAVVIKIAVGQPPTRWTPRVAAQPSW
jgi:hypothetical protein